MTSTLMACVLAAGVPPGGPVDADQFARLMSALHSPLRDITLVYEGESRFVGPHSLLKGAKDSADRTYQGFYAFRSDGATLLDVYDRFASGGGQFRREISAMLKWKVERFGQYADRKNAIGGVVKHPGDPGAFFTDGSPERILYSWYFQFWPSRWISEPGVTAFEFQGWEDVEGHRCLRVQRDALIHSAGGPVLRFWVDVERGGHPLRYEMWAGNQLNVRVDRIQLERLPIGEGRVPLWLPVSGVEEDFVWETKHFSTPLFRSTYAIVHGSIRVNQGLTDDQFSIKSNLLSRAPELAKVRGAFDATPPLRTDPEGVRVRLDAALAEADRQSEQLMASAPTPEGQAGATVIRFGALALALLLLGGASYRKWKGR